MTDDALRKACEALYDNEVGWGKSRAYAIEKLEAFAKSQRAAGIREAKVEVERIDSGYYEHDRGLETIQEWCEARAKELEA